MASNLGFSLAFERELINLTLIKIINKMELNIAKNNENGIGGGDGGGGYGGEGEDD